MPKAENWQISQITSDNGQFALKLTKSFYITATAYKTGQFAVKRKALLFKQRGNNPLKRKNYTVKMDNSLLKTVTKVY